ncbi:angio-associated migratory cell protein [Lates japonicus]|uniref:Angio-associated migratory cell protein n=1 Tax=Lates japonicus TaxID=270547 RepID=A0AAD3MY76_LATJO|nr:angio-associated migratory cell protein [Lates japonicus]
MKAGDGGLDGRQSRMTASSLSKHTGSVFCVKFGSQAQQLGVVQEERMIRLHGGVVSDGRLCWSAQSWSGIPCYPVPREQIYRNGVDVYIPAGDCKPFQSPVSYQRKSPARRSDGVPGALDPPGCNKDGSGAVGSVTAALKLINTTIGQGGCHGNRRQKVVGVFSLWREAKKDRRLFKTLTCGIQGFCNILPLIAVSYLDGTLAIYDVSSQVLRHRCQHEAGIVHLQWEESSSVVSTCSLDGALRLWDARSGNMVSEYHGHTAEILDFTINREASLAVTASGDNQGKVFCLQRPDR